MAESLPAESAVFVIRIWLERTGSGGAKRGYVEHIASGQRHYFSELRDGMMFVAIVGEMPLTSTTKPNSDS